MKKYILGINLPIKARCHESGVALIDKEGNVIFAASEERFSRKNWMAISLCCQLRKCWNLQALRGKTLNMWLFPPSIILEKFLDLPSLFLRKDWAIYLNRYYKVFYKLFLSEKMLLK